MNKREFAKIVDMIDAYYPGRIQDKAMLTVNWYDDFKECDYDAILSCLNKYKRENRFPPTIADLLTAYNDGVERTNYEIVSQALNNIKPSLSWLVMSESPEDCLKQFYEIMERTPLTNKYLLARRIGEELHEYSLRNSGTEFNFSEWIKGIINE